MLLFLAGSSATGQPHAAPRPAVATTRPGEVAATRPAVMQETWPAPNPHRPDAACSHCHRMNGDEPLPIPGQQVDTVCLHCHDGRQAPRERHPVGRTFVSPQVTQPQGWPAVDNRLGCLTCHDVYRSAHPQGQPRVNNPDFLRGEPGAPLLSFCGQCHVQDAGYDRYNPHVMLTDDGSRGDAACLFCHTRTFEPASLMQRSGTPALRGGPLLLCAGCHHEHPDYFSPGHIGHRVGRGRLAYMAAAEKAAPGAPVSDDAVARALADNVRPTRLPLGPGDTIVCSTCHNPHPHGAFPPGSMLGAGGQVTGDASSRLPFRGLNKDLCRACHDQ